MIPRGMSRLGSRASSAASGTPSTARKNQIPYTSAASTPATPNGRNALAPNASVGGMSRRLSKENRGSMPTTNAISASTATTVMPSITLSASPTPYRWMPMKIA